MDSGSSQARFTAIYFHGADGNLGDTVNALSRGFTMQDSTSLPSTIADTGRATSRIPAKQRWREDAESAITYLTGTRHIPADAMVLVGKDLGANLALEIAAAHSGSQASCSKNHSNHQPLPYSAIRAQARSGASAGKRALAELRAAASNVLIPSLWFYWMPERNARIGTGQAGSLREVSGTQEAGLAHRFAQ